MGPIPHHLGVPLETKGWGATHCPTLRPHRFDCNDPSNPQSTRSGSSPATRFSFHRNQPPAPRRFGSCRLDTKRRPRGDSDTMGRERPPNRKPQTLGNRRISRLRNHRWNRLTRHPETRNTQFLDSLAPIRSAYPQSRSVRTGPARRPRTGGLQRRTTRVEGGPARPIVTY